jgi:hypothetical protein
LFFGTFRTFGTTERPNSSIAELRSSLDKVHLEAEEIRHAIQLQKPVLYDAHRRISAVTKALGKLAS